MWDVLDVTHRRPTLTKAMTKIQEEEPRTPMYFRIRPSVRRRFRAVALLAGETAEVRMERMMIEDISRVLDTSTAAPSAAR